MCRNVHWRSESISITILLFRRADRVVCMRAQKRAHQQGQINNKKHNKVDNRNKDNNNKSNADKANKKTEENNADVDSDNLGAALCRRPIGWGYELWFYERCAVQHTSSFGGYVYRTVCSCLEQRWLMHYEELLAKLHAPAWNKAEGSPGITYKTVCSTKEQS